MVVASGFNFYLFLQVPFSRESVLTRKVYFELQEVTLTMKKTGILTVFLMVFAFAAHAQSSSIKIESGAAPGHLPRFNWEETTHNFGQVAHAQPVVHEFKFNNMGKSPLIISNVQGSCGCTVTEYTKEPVLPGKAGMVKAIFDAKALGSFNKSIRVTANVEGGAETLYIKGEVVQN